MSKKKKIILISVCAALVLIGAACLIAVSRIADLFPSQTEYERWRGENETEFAQISCFIPASEGVTMSSINAFRTDMVKAFREATVDGAETRQLFTDSISCEGSCKVVSDRAYTDASVIAVGADFFEFHPMKLFSGRYISDSDMLTDTVILDEELAWFLFGATDVSGLTVKISDEVFYVAGVVDREDDFASKEAYKGGMGLYMPYLSYLRLHENDAPITCYEVTMPDPVKNYALNLITEKFPSKKAEIVENTGRFSSDKLFKNAFSISKSAIASSAPIPYWENAVRYAKNVCSILYVFALACFIFPVITIVRITVKGAKRLGNHLGEDVVPAWKDDVEEKVRVKQRRRWEKKHPGQK